MGHLRRRTALTAIPLTFALNYWLGEGGVTGGPVSGAAGYEVLEGNGSIGFATPLCCDALWVVVSCRLSTPFHLVRNKVFRAISIGERVCII